MLPHSVVRLVALFVFALGSAPALTPAVEFQEKDEVLILRDTDLRDGEKVTPIYAGKMAIVREVRKDQVRVEYDGEKKGGWIISRDIASRSDAWPLLSERIKRDAKDWQALRARSALWMHQKKFDRAAADLEAALAANPRDAKSWRFRGIVQMALQDYEKAIADFSEALRLDPQIADGRLCRTSSQLAKAGLVVFETQEDRWVGRFELWKRNCLSQEVQRQIDTDIQKALLNIAPGDNRMLLVRAHVRLWNEEYEEVISDATEANRLNNRDGNSLLLRGMAYVECKKYREAILDLDQVVKLDASKTGPATELRCAAYLMLGDFKSAIASQTASINYNPQGHKYYNRAIIRMAQYRPVNVHLENARPKFSYLAFTPQPEFGKEDADLILSDFAAAEKDDPTQCCIFEDRGLLHYWLTQDDEAIADISEAMRLGSARENILHVRANAYARKGLLILAYADIEQAAKKNPENLEIVKGHARVALRLNKFDEAIAIYGRIIEKETTCENFVARGTAWMLARNCEKAAADLDRALELDPQSQDARIRRGIVYGQGKQFEQAMKCFNEALRINPSSGEAYAWRSLARFERREFDAAFADAQKAVETAPNLADSFHRRGVVYLHQSKNKLAAADFEEALKLTPTITDVPTHVLRVIAYLKDQKFQKAVQCADESLKIYPESTDIRKLREEAVSALPSIPRSAKNPGGKMEKATR